MYPFMVHYSSAELHDLKRKEYEPCIICTKHIYNGLSKPLVPFQKRSGGVSVWDS